MISEAVAFERGISPLLDKLLDERLSDVLSFSPDPEIERRIEELAGKSTEGGLSSEDKAEYEGYVRANKFLAIIRREAQRRADAKRWRWTRQPEPLSESGPGTVASTVS